MKLGVVYQVLRDKTQGLLSGMHWKPDLYGLEDATEKRQDKPL